MPVIKFEKVPALPAVLAPSTMYFVPGATAEFLEIYVSDKTGSSARHVPSVGDINSRIASALATLSAIKVVADIAARDALVPTTVTQALVLNATADLSVKAGAATYVFNPADSSWTKIAEHESMDVVLQWNDIQDKPTSAVADIDDAVAKRHSHANKALLDTIEVVSGEVKVNGDFIYSHLDQEAW